MTRYLVAEKMNWLKKSLWVKIFSATPNYEYKLRFLSKSENRSFDMNFKFLTEISKNLECLFQFGTIYDCKTPSGLLWVKIEIFIKKVEFGFLSRKHVLTQFSSGWVSLWPGILESVPSRDNFAQISLFFLGGDLDL